MEPSHKRCLGGALLVEAVGCVAIPLASSLCGDDDGQLGSGAWPGDFE